MAGRQRRSFYFKVKRVRRQAGKRPEGDAKPAVAAPWPICLVLFAHLVSDCSVTTVLLGVKITYLRYVGKILCQDFKHNFPYFGM